MIYSMFNLIGIYLIFIIAGAWILGRESKDNNLNDFCLILDTIITTLFAINILSSFAICLF